MSNLFGNLVEQVGEYSFTSNDGREILVPVYRSNEPTITKIEDPLSEAILHLKRTLPGWWFTVGECSVSCDATVGPDRAYISEPYLSMFDDGFSCDLSQPSTIADALREATDLAFNAYSKAKEQDKVG